MGTASTECVLGSVAPNSTYDFSIPMTAPASQTTDQTYRDTWKFYKGSTALPIVSGGAGNTIWTQIIVEATAGNINAINGIDVSDHQGYINWSNVKSDGIVFSYIKSTEGYINDATDAELISASALESRYRENMDAALNAGVLVAPYHFVRPDLNQGVEEARKEAAFFVSFIRPYYEENALLPPAIDVENSPNVDNYCTGGLLGCYTKTTLTDWLLAFAEEVELLLGVQPIFYMNQNFTLNYVDSRLASTYKLWISRYAIARPVPSHWNQWLFWQNSSTGSVSGISGDVDKNIFEGTQSELEGYLTQIDVIVNPNPRPWDFNNDDIVDYLDLGILADHWLLTENDPNWDPKLNLNTTEEAGLQVINYLDLGILADHWLE